MYADPLFGIIIAVVVGILTIPLLIGGYMNPIVTVILGVAALAVAIAVTVRYYKKMKRRGGRDESSSGKDRHI